MTEYDNTQAFADAMPRPELPPCPIWCRVEHRDEGLIRHVTVERVTPLSCHTYASIEVRMTVYGQHYSLEDQPTVHMSWGDGEEHLMLEIDEAEALIEHLRRTVVYLRMPDAGDD